MKCISVQIRPAGRKGTSVPLPRLDAAFAASPYGGEAWTLVADQAALALSRTPSVFSIGDGFLGIRGPGEAPGAPRSYLNGVFEVTPIRYHEAAHGYARASDTRIAAADATCVTVSVDGTEASLRKVELDMAAGVRREFREGQGVEVIIETFVAMEHRGVVVTRVRLTAGQAVQVRVHRTVTPPPRPSVDTSAVYDPRIAPDTGAQWVEERLVAEPDMIGRVDRLRRSRFAVAAVARPLDETFDLASGEVRVIDSVAAYAALRDADPLITAAAALATAPEVSALVEEQRAWFDRFWAATGIALADASAAQALRHGLFQLVQSVGRDGTTSLSAKGQTGEGYEGHVFWDAEIYALPVFVYLVPAIARAMLMWRIERLDAARSNARLMGHDRGALYPWRTIAGAECSSFFPAGAAQYHINADIAHALQLYVMTTGDRSILTDGGSAMLAETARIWLQIGFHDPSRGDAFVINRVTGPDEYSALVDNNLYTNLMAAGHLRFAAEAGDVGADEAAAMRRAADAMFIFYDTARDVPAQDDGFFALAPWPFDETPSDRYPLLLHHHPLAIYRHRVAKQADAVLAAALLPGEFDPSTRRRMLDVYEECTVHDSTLSASAFAMLAAQVGETGRGAAYWRASLLTDLTDLFGNSGHGLHMAALAGGWTALALGFGGLWTLDGNLHFAPRWAAEIGDYSLQIQFQGRKVRLQVTAAETRYALVEGPPLALLHHGETLWLDGVVVR